MYEEMRYSIICWLTVVGAAALLGLTACGGPPRATRVAVMQLGEGLVIADEAVAREVETRGDEVRAQVEGEVDAGMITNVEAGLARFEELMQPTTDARQALQTAHHAAFSLERGLDAWAEGTSSESSFLDLAACAGAAFTSLVRALESAGVELPAVMAGPLEWLGAFAETACPAND